MDAVALSLVSAALFGAMTVAIRLALARSRDAALGAVAMTAVAAAVCLFLALAFPRGGDTSLGAVWPFAVAGLLAPGLSQLAFTRAIAEAGPSRTSVVVGTAPLVAVAIAVPALGEPVEAALVVGAALIVGGGVALASERVRPEHFRAIGLALAFGATVLFAARDNVLRWLAGDTDVSPLLACAAALAAGTALGAAVTLARRGAPSARALGGSLRAFAPAGLLFGLSYVALFEAYYRGRVSVVSPLVATESLWGVTLSALVIGRSELVGRRLVAGAALVVAGGVLIGLER